MSKANIITLVLLIVITVFGWFTLMKDTAADKLNYKEAVKTGDEWCKKGLYLRSVRKYREALEIENNEKVWEKVIDAYELEYQENPDIISEYIDVLVEALEVTPDKYDFAERLAELYLEKNKYEEAYDCLIDLKEYGIDDEDNLDDLNAMITDIKYSFKVKTTIYHDFQPMSGETYTVNRNSLWGAIDAEGSSVIKNECKYLGPLNEESVRVITGEEDSRIRDEENVTLGIFSKEVTDAGIYSEDLVPAKIGDTYSYYDSFADKVFGDYDYAGNFQDGKAAVQKKGKWYLVDKEGKKKGSEYYDIVLSLNGYYDVDGVILAAEKEGKYSIYDSDWEKVSDFTCDDMDVCTNDKLIAFKSGDKWGYVDAEGEVVIKPQYSDAKSFSNGLAAVCVDGKWGFIDKNNEIVIECQFKDADYFNEFGSCMVSSENEEDPDGQGWNLLILRINNME